MKDLFYGLLSSMIILVFIVGMTYEKQLEQPKHKGAVVIEKDDVFLYGFSLCIKYDNDSIVLLRAYQVFYDKYNVGDTIK